LNDLSALTVYSLVIVYVIRIFSVSMHFGY